MKNIIYYKLETWTTEPENFFDEHTKVVTNFATLKEAKEAAKSFDYYVILKVEVRPDEIDDAERQDDIFTVKAKPDSLAIA